MNIYGKDRITSVTIQKNNTSFSISCDTLVFTGNWVPDNELARRGDIECDLNTKSPLVDDNFETSRAGVYAVGNLLVSIKSADQCVLEIRNSCGNSRSPLIPQFLPGAPEGIRTPNLLIRSQMLYPLSYGRLAKSQ